MHQKVKDRILQWIFPICLLIIVLGLAFMKYTEHQDNKESERFFRSDIEEAKKRNFCNDGRILVVHQHLLGTDKVTKKYVYFGYEFDGDELSTALSIHPREDGKPGYRVFYNRQQIGQCP